MDEFAPNLPTFRMPIVKSIPEVAWEALQREVAEFQSLLTSDQEVGVVVNGATSVIHVSTLRRSGQMVVFDGVDNAGRTARLIQHFSQVNVQMIAVDAIAEQARRIGF